MTTFINISKQYGEQVEATVTDYQELNPEGKFVEKHGQIREYFSGTPGDYVIVAQSEENIRQIREELGIKPKP